MIFETEYRHSLWLLLQVQTQIPCLEHLMSGNVFL